jgi:eukaryotic-like serine/threonine-protein kinase
MSSQPGSQRLGKYELRERLGRGGMSEVWKAFDTQLQRYVAIKLLHADLQTDPEFITRFTREARVIASLHHPNIVQIYDFQTTNPSESNVPGAYMVMEYVEGQTLAQYIRTTSRVGKFPPAIDIVHLFTSISKAIDYAHREGMIHRDIKPANILLDKRKTEVNPMGEPVLTDFGIAKLMGATSGTMSGMWLGTPLYISPEQAQGHPGNERSDIYSLGVILYEICTGVQPFRAESAAGIMMQHVNSMPTPPALINPNIPPALTMVILRAMAKEPAARFSSASALTVALAEAFNLPIPTDLPLPAFPIDSMDDPDRHDPGQQHPPAAHQISGATAEQHEPAIGQQVAAGDPQQISDREAQRPPDRWQRKVDD